jgi:folate-binding protein YgfZ
MMNQAFPSRALIAIEGEEAQAYLNALLTQAIAAPDQRRAQYAAMLSPQGKVAFDAFVIGRGEQGYWLDVAQSRAELALQRLKLFALRRKVTISLDPSAAVTCAPALQPGETVQFSDPRLPGDALGVRIYRPFAGQTEPGWAPDRISLGVPDLSIDLAPDEAFGLEALLEELSGVDFHKGCFPGQENISRMKRRATTRRKFCRIRIDGPPPPFGAAILAGEAQLGEVRSGQDGAALALIRLDRAREAIAAGLGLTCEGRAIALDAPDWLIWPAGEE